MMNNKLSAIIIIMINFLHILVNGSDLKIESQVQHQKHLQLQTEPKSQPNAQLQVGRPPKKNHKKHPWPRTRPRPQHRPLQTHLQPQPGLHPQPLPIPTPLPTKPLPHKGPEPKPLPIPTPLPTKPLPHKGPQPQLLPIPTPLPLPHKGLEPHPLPIPTPLPTQPLPHPQVPNQDPHLSIPTPGKTLPQLPLQGNSLRDMYNAMSSSKPQAYLAAHNVFRAKVGVPPLKWDKKLEYYALKYGSKRAADCRLQHSFGPYGENLFWELYEESSPEKIVKSFTDEQQNYDLSKGECKCQQETGKCMCGHFTAIIWKTTERVGCAEVKCEAEKGKLVVCSYDPPGNVIGQDPLHTQ